VLVVVVPFCDVCAGAFAVGYQGRVEGGHLEGEKVQLEPVSSFCAGSSVGQRCFELAVG